MGLSASQARLLSITARLTDNEYHSQQLTNAKMRLAAKGTEARKEYQDALSSKTLIYNGYDAQGNSISTALTPNVIYQYLPLKNQYSLVNMAGQVLVGHEDAKNFEQTDTMVDFLDRYGLIENYNELTSYPEEYQKYLTDLAKWNSDVTAWNAANQAYQDYLEAYADWQDSQTGNELLDTFAENIGTSDNPHAPCYRRSVQEGNASCYLHLLNMLLDYDGGTNLVSHPYKASCGQNGEFDDESRELKTNTYMGDMNNSIYFPVMAQVSDYLNETGRKGNLKRLCDGDDSFGGSGPSNLIQAAIDDKRTPTPVEILRSDFIYDPVTKSVKGVKSLKQKAIDLYFLISKNMISGTAALAETLINFTEGDMGGHSTPEPTPVDPPGDLPGPKPQEPEMPSIILNDREKAQWYVNLWCRMNGEEEPPRIHIKDGIRTNEESQEVDEWFREYVLKSGNAVKDTIEKHYAELDSNLASSTTWLEDVLSQGIVVMQRVNSHNTDTKNKYSWDAVIYTDASELTLETDDNAIAKAEVKYEEKMHEIQVKDKRYQLEINKLDSEHNALQTQVDSIRGEISKNIDRSFKTFS